MSLLSWSAKVEQRNDYRHKYGTAGRLSEEEQWLVIADPEYICDYGYGL